MRRLFSVHDSQLAGSGHQDFGFIDKSSLYSLLCADRFLSLGSWNRRRWLVSRFLLPLYSVRVSLFLYIPRWLKKINFFWHCIIIHSTLSLLSSRLERGKVYYPNYSVIADTVGTWGISTVYACQVVPSFLFLFFRAPRASPLSCPTHPRHYYLPMALIFPYARCQTPVIPWPAECYAENGRK